MRSSRCVMASACPRPSTPRAALHVLRPTQPQHRAPTLPRHSASRTHPRRAVVHPGRLSQLVGPRAGNASGPASDVPSGDAILERVSQALNSGLEPVMQELKAIKAEVKAMKTAQGSSTRLVGRLAEMLALQNLPPDLEGCRMVRIRNAGDLDRFLGDRTAAAVMKHMLGSPEARLGARAALLRALLKELASAGLGASEEAQAVQTLAARLGTPGAAAEVTAQERSAVQNVIDLLKASGRLGEDPGPRMHAAFQLSRQLCGSQPHHLEAPAADSAVPVLALFLLATGTLQATLELDMARWTPADRSGSAADLLVVEVKADLREAAKAVKQLDTALRVLWLAHLLACRAVPGPGPHGDGGSAAGDEDGLRMTAAVCGILNGDTLQDVRSSLGELSLQLELGGQPLQKSVPVRVYSVGPMGRLVRCETLT